MYMNDEIALVDFSEIDKQLQDVLRSHVGSLQSELVNFPPFSACVPVEQMLIADIFEWNSNGQLVSKERSPQRWIF